MLNVVALLGRLTADPELRTTQSGLSVCSFTVAVDRNTVNADGNRQADFINCVTWRQTTEFVSRYFSKGKMIGLQGSIQTRNYEDRNGNKRTAVEVITNNVSFAGDKDRGQQSSLTDGYAHPGAGYTQPRQAAQRQSAKEYERPSSYQQGSFNDFQDITPDEDLPF